ncbi:MAG: hypothetical protein HY393_00545 [Candidatus Diapherotrites archaeon]|nr:hypothetical protein [Candidatus Diapherotrites archaeon]
MTEEMQEEAVEEMQGAEQGINPEILKRMNVNGRAVRVPVSTLVRRMDVYWVAS